MSKEPSDHPTVVDPETHTVVFENQALRVVEAKIPAGRRVPSHTHPPRLIIPMAEYRMLVATGDGEETIVHRSAGDARWVEGETHEAEALDLDVWAIEVEPKR